MTRSLKLRGAITLAAVFALGLLTGSYWQAKRDGREAREHPEHGYTLRLKNTALGTPARACFISIEPGHKCFQDFTSFDARLQRQLAELSRLRADRAVMDKYYRAGRVAVVEEGR